MDKLDTLVYIGDIEIKNSKLGGYGVFAKQTIKKGTLIESGIMSVLNNVNGSENPMLFTWSDDKTKWAIGTGLLHYYNHSDNPNIKKKGDLINNTLKIYALRDIDVGEELLGSYYSKKWRECFQSF